MKKRKVGAIAPNRPKRKMATRKKAPRDSKVGAIAPNRPRAVRVNAPTTGSRFRQAKDD